MFDFLNTLCLIFIFLKLNGSISWTWWLILMPLIVKFIFMIGIFIFFGNSKDRKEYL